MQGDPNVRFDEQGVETDCLVSPTGEPHDTAPPPDSTPHGRGSDRRVPVVRHRRLKWPIAPQAAIAIWVP